MPTKKPVNANAARIANVVKAEENVAKVAARNVNAQIAFVQRQIAVPPNNAAGQSLDNHNAANE